MIRDPARLDELLEATRAFVTDIAIPNEDRVEREDQIPDIAMDAMRDIGTFGWSIPEEFGGSGLTGEELALAFIELTQCSVAYRVVGATNAGIGSECIIRDGTREQQDRYLPSLAAGDRLGCLALTEEHAGSDATALRTRAIRDGDDYVVDGHKRYITLAPIADLYTVFARTDDNERGSRGISAFLIERGTPGLQPGEPTPKMGQEGAPIGEIVLDGCRVPASSIIGGTPGVGFATLMKALNKQRLNLSALSIGPAIRLLDEALEYSGRRQQFGRPIGDNQLVQAMLAECKVDIESSRALVLQTARAFDAGDDVTMAVSMCKYLATEMCGRVADRVVQIFGGQGYVKESGIERFYRDVRAARIYEGTSQIHLINIARRLEPARRRHDT
ncbi:acyl-CoA dehydrogenase family protein [Ilumatobacter nonamiensis]|uniref:acyl-CoA dehydrogenase family protein n=1 Tax=Ilumatobacter nonamiensis TaxID=467093 RepID=UPI0003467701|nr:acyl-CoA dehydrogenase family protein [Ilumatobacter nonamiensis]